jgi:hypothetical protein
LGKKEILEKEKNEKGFSLGIWKKNMRRKGPFTCQKEQEKCEWSTICLTFAEKKL